MKDDQVEILRNIPKVGDLIEEKGVRELLDLFGRGAVVATIREIMDEVREMVLDGRLAEDGLKRFFDRDFLNTLRARLGCITQGGIRKVVNATGIVLHTNLGRAPLALPVADALRDVASSYTNLEFDLSRGERWNRHLHLDHLARAVTGAESSFPVNNNAAALLLVLNTLAEGKEVIVSRGELVEIGGSFRLPEVMEKSGAVLREVGTTNKTFLRDYERAVTPETALILKVHRSNFRLSGFVEETGISRLLPMCRRMGLPLVFDMGSGCLFPLNMEGSDEPVVEDAVRDGVDIVTFSCDKLLGGPQAGLILGRSDLIERVQANPLSRAIRIDKLNLCALIETLRLYFLNRGDPSVIPVYRMLNAPLTALRERAEALSIRLNDEVPGLGQFFDIRVEEEKGFAGGGSLPGVELASSVVTLTPLTSGMDLEDIERALLSATVPVVGRKGGGRYIIDTRTLMAGDEDLIVSALTGLLRGDGEEERGG